MWVLQPPKMVDFEGNYSAWVAKQRANAQAAATEQRQAKAKPKSNPPKAAPPAKSGGKRSDNPSARPYGRVPMEDLEKDIAKTEAALAVAQARMGESEVYRDAGKTKAAQAECDRLAAKLKAMEAEYFGRTQ